MFSHYLIFIRLVIIGNNRFITTLCQRYANIIMTTRFYVIHRIIREIVQLFKTKQPSIIQIYTFDF